MDTIMIPTSFENTLSTRYPEQQEEQTTSPTLPLVNIDSSELTPAPQGIELHRRSKIEVVNKFPLRYLLRKSYRLSLGLTKNNDKIDTYHRELTNYADQNNPLDTYSSNKSRLRDLESKTNESLRLPILRHNNRRYEALKTRVGEQTQRINALLEDNLKRAIQSFSNIVPLLDFVESELSEFMVLSNTFSSLQESLITLFDKDQHPGNAETLRLIYLLYWRINQESGREHNHSGAHQELKEILSDMAVKTMGCDLDSLDTMELLKKFVENNHCYISTLSTSGHKALIQHLINRIERLPKEKVCADSLFLINEKMENLFKDDEKAVLKKAFSVLCNEAKSLVDSKAAFYRVYFAGLGQDEVAERIFSKMYASINNFNDALEAFNQFKQLSVRQEFFDGLYEKVMSCAVSAEHFHQLALNSDFDKDRSKLCLEGLAKYPCHIELKKLHKNLIEKKIFQQFDKAAEKSANDFIENCQSQIQGVVELYETEYQKQYCELIQESIKLYDEKIMKAETKFENADWCFRNVDVSSHNDDCMKKFQETLKKAVVLAMEAMILAPTDEMRNKGEQLINSYFSKEHRAWGFDRKKIHKPSKIFEIINKIKANQTIECKYQNIKTNAIRNLEGQLNNEVSNKLCELYENVNRKKEELSTSLPLLHQKLGSYYSGLTHMKPTERYFPVDGFWMPYLYIALFRTPECTVNTAYGSDPGELRVDLSPSTSTENLSIPASGFSYDIDVGDFASQPLDISAGLSLDSVDLFSELVVSSPDIGDVVDVAGDVAGFDSGDVAGFDSDALGISSLSISSLGRGEYSGGEYSGGEYSGGEYSGGEYSGGVNSGDDYSRDEYSGGGYSGGGYSGGGYSGDDYGVGGLGGGGFGGDDYF
ncbi:hypothetical protein J7438_17425 [Thalassotalea sp. G20_0]|uniref:hypothetical protein n=1 Tax=Thalassotalea sp. G20_0 TaxID=2821093 RepID=UPI001ADAD91C|nr:hypothetical protein [Thalassotalea sp. G20_0]MBO9495847.1 hypothetical protein [Thalassotalea sp. G20_0]